MKKKKRNKIIYTILFSILILSIFTLNSFALEIMGVDYYEQWNCNVVAENNEDNLQCKLFTNYNSPRVISQNPDYTLNYYIKAILNEAQISYTENDLQDATIISYIEVFNQGGYIIPLNNVHQSYIEENTISQYLHWCNQYYDDLVKSEKQTGSWVKLFQLAKNEDANIIFIYNNSFKFYLIQNVQGFLNHYCNYKNIDFAIEDFLSQCKLNQLDFQDISDLNLNIANFVSFHYQRSGQIFEYPMNTEFDIRSAVKYLTKQSTWNFLPTSISHIILNYVIVLFGIGTTLGLISIVKRG